LLNCPILVERRWPWAETNDDFGRGKERRRVDGGGDAGEEEAAKEGMMMDKRKHRQHNHVLPSPGGIIWVWIAVRWGEEVHPNTHIGWKRGRNCGEKMISIGAQEGGGTNRPTPIFRF
jgi:hypothetical protein